MGNSFGYLDLTGTREFAVALTSAVRPSGGLVIDFNTGFVGVTDMDEQDAVGLVEQKHAGPDARRGGGREQWSWCSSVRRRLLVIGRQRYPARHRPG